MPPKCERDFREPGIDPLAVLNTLRPMRDLLLRAFLATVVCVLACSCMKKKSVATAEKNNSATDAENAAAVASSSPADASPPSGARNVDSAAESNENAPRSVIPGVPVELADSARAYEAWFARHGLDLNDPKMLDADPDGDGASNRDEFMADTNPRDPNSRPGVHPFMRLKEFHEVKIPLLLESIEGETARIKHTDEADGKTESVRAGQTIAGKKVLRVTVRKDIDKHGEPVDLSRVELEDPQSKEKIVLVKDLPSRSASSYAVLVSPDRQTSVNVKQGETFVWPSEPNVTYKVIDLRPEQAVVQQVDTKKLFTFPAQ
jgi:hypothetical protein